MGRWPCDNGRAGSDIGGQERSPAGRALRLEFTHALYVGHCPLVLLLVRHHVVKVTNCFLVLSELLALVALGGSVVGAGFLHVEASIE